MATDHVTIGDSSTIFQAKIKLRSKLRSIVISHPFEQSIELSFRLKEFIQGLGSSSTRFALFPLKMGGFFPQGHEPQYLSHITNDDRFEISFPVMSSDFYYTPSKLAIASLEASLRKGTQLFYLSPPVLKDSKKRHLNQLAMILVPGLGFSKQGNRIGRGQGHYDRVLSNYSGIKIGLCYESHLREDHEIIKEDHDQRVDFIVTNKQVINCQFA